METKEIALKLVKYCRAGEWERAHNELYATNAKSIEPIATDDFPKEAHGMDAIKAKSEKFDSSVEEMHSIDVSEPLVAGNSFAFTLAMDVTIKGLGRVTTPEICVYEVKDGKIVSEQFFF